jgi:undecaprenyl-diphosphatase
MLPGYLLLKKISIPLYIGILISALLLLAAFLCRDKGLSRHKFKDVLFIGVMQSFAILPGISRSASTISAACMRGWTVAQAVRFSFLLAIPTVFMGTLVESLQIKATDIAMPTTIYLTGFFTSLCVGLFFAKLILSIRRGHLAFFALYLLFLGLFLLWR